MAELEFSKSAPLEGNIYVPSLVTSMAIGYMQKEGTLYDKIFPLCPTDADTGFYTKWNKGDIMRAITQPRSEGSHAEIGQDVTVDSTYAITYFGAKKRYHQNQIRNWKIQPTRERAAINLLTQAAILRRETKFVTAAFSTSKWIGSSTGTDLVGGTDFTLWSDPSSTPIEDVRAQCTAMQKKTGMRPNKMAIGREVYDALVDNPEIVARMPTGNPNGQPRLVMLQQLAAIFELDEVVIASRVYESADKGATSSMAFVAGKNALLIYVTDSPSTDTPSAGYTFTNQLAGGNAQGILLRNGINQEDNYEFYTIDHGEDFRITASDLGVFFSNAVA